ncbi:hypothetical protein U8016_002597 [Vibrio parahaemolyticus]|nr:hypothetical protein [Vibrio parahaemolyticus]
MSLQHPEDILKHALSTFSEATKGLAEIKIGSFTSARNNVLVYTHLKSKYVDQYKLDCIAIKYPLSIYPLKLIIRDENLAKKFDSHEIECNDKGSLCEAIESFFLSDVFTEKVKSLINIALIKKPR